MKVTGLITEYNPFHNGHKYHIEEARRLTGADYIVVVMSGDFVQRGAPACMDKYLRTQMALTNGADIVIELPTLFATASAEYFALGAVELLDSLGFVDSICFGSEVGEITPLLEIAKQLVKESDSFKQTIAKYLHEGDSYPLARKKALLHELNDSQSVYEEILSSPNNILGTEYLKALLMLHSPMKAYTIKRKESMYHEETLSDDISSATAIRKELVNNELDTLATTMPPSAYGLMNTYYGKRLPIQLDDFSSELYHALLYMSTEDLTTYLDITEDLSARIKNILHQYETYTQFGELLKTKNYTMTRITRALCHILLHLKQSSLHPSHLHTDSDRFKLSNRTLPLYVRILGMRKEATCLLKKKTLHNRLPIITKVADAPNFLSIDALTMLQMDLNASHLYQQKVFEKYGTRIKGEYTHGVVFVD